MTVIMFMFCAMCVFMPVHLRYTAIRPLVSLTCMHAVPGLVNHACLAFKISYNGLHMKEKRVTFNVLSDKFAVQV